VMESPVTLSVAVFVSIQMLITYPQMEL